MKMSAKTILVSFGFLVAFLLSAGFASADGTQTICTNTYGGGTECREVDVPREEIVHTPIETGVVENVVLAISLFVSGYLVLLLAKRYEIIK